MPTKNIRGMLVTTAPALPGSVTLPRRGNALRGMSVP
jgi:hypothetical protein